MRKFFVFLGVVLATIGSVVSAQEVDSMAPLQMSSWGDAKTSETIDYMPEISLDTRLGYNHNFSGRSGRFAGDGLYLDINGYLSPNLSYSLNHRIASSYYGDDITGFGATNWLTLTYEVGSFAFTAGKDALLMGSFEYDAYDLDSYYDMNSAFYNALDCWQWGVSAAWYPADDHEVILQVANSPFGDGFDMFSYAAGWRGAWDFYESYWTVNMWQYDAGKYAKALNLGNRFTFGDFMFDLEFMTRSDSMKGLFRDDFTFLFAPSYEITDWCRAFSKFGWERNSSFFYGEDAENIFWGVGAEFFPLKGSRDLRLHAAWTSNEYTCGNALDIGVTWKMNLTRMFKGILTKKRN